MSEFDRRHIGRMRRLKAVSFVLAILLMAPGVEAVVTRAMPSFVEEASASPSSIDASRLIGVNDAFGSLERIEQLAESSGVEVPRVFASEIGVLPLAHDIRVSGGGSVVGYVVDDQPHRVFERLSNHMEHVGWTSVPLGQDDAATFVKSGGECTWALVTCVPAGDATSVVVRCMEP